MAKLNTVEQIRILKAAGYGVFVSHRRPLRGAKRKSPLLTRYELVGRGGTPADFSPTGGLTTVAIVDLSDPAVVLAEGESPCSFLDHFNKKRGLDIAFGRAYHSLKQREVSDG